MIDHELDFTKREEKKWGRWEDEKSSPIEIIVQFDSAFNLSIFYLKIIKSWLVEEQTVNLLLFASTCPSQEQPVVHSWTFFQVSHPHQPLKTLHQQRH